jgi:hypothetical protein
MLQLLYPLAKEPLTPIEWVWMQWQKEKSLLCSYQESQPELPAHSLLTGTEKCTYITNGHKHVTVICIYIDITSY